MQGVPPTCPMCQAKIALEVRWRFPYPWATQGGGAPRGAAVAVGGDPGGAAGAHGGLGVHGGELQQPGGLLVRGVELQPGADGRVGYLGG